MLVFPRHETYTDSKVDFIGEIPSHWTVTRIANVFEEIHTVNKPEEELLSLDRYKGIIKQSETGRKTRASKDRSAYRLIEPGQLGYNILNAFMGSIGVSKYRGILSPAYAVAKTREEQNTWYFHYLFRTDLYKRQFNRFSYGIMLERNRLYFDRFKTINTIVPPRDEQDKIVAYLRVQDAHIARFIKTKRKLIELLNEQKQTLIHQAVTKGIDPNVTLKPSGIDWLGDIPEHWIVKPLKHWVDVNKLTLAEGTDPNYEFQYIDIGTVKTGRLIKKPQTMFFYKSPSRARRILQKGDTIVSTVRTYLKAIWFVNEGSENLVASTGFAVFSPKQDVEPEYLGYIIQSDNFVDRVSANSIGIAYPAINESALSRFKIAMPPTKDEQKSLIARIKSEMSPLDDAISKATNEIDLILEYRERLITDAIIGQIDVRNWQPGPDDDVDDTGISALAEGDELLEEEYEDEDN